MITRELAGRLDVALTLPIRPPLPPGIHDLGLFEKRDAKLLVPESLPRGAPAALMVLFHGGGGSAAKILPMMEQHSRFHGFLLLIPQSLFPTWDIVIAGNGPDRERLEIALRKVITHFFVDPNRLAFGGHSDGGSYALSLGLTNGHFVTHVIASSAGFMSVHDQQGAPRIFLSHGTQDQQIPIERSGRVHAARLAEAGYDVTYVEYNGSHAYRADVVSQAVAFFLSD